MTVALVLFAATGLAAFAVCQALLPALTRSRQRAWLLNAVLAATGLGVAWAMGVLMPALQGADLALLMIASFAWVYVPAAAILLIKRATHPGH